MFEILRKIALAAGCGLVLGGHAAPAVAQNTANALQGYRFEIAENVPNRERRVILEAMARSQAYFARFGIRLSEAQRGRFVTKIVNTGQGNQEPFGGGGCCTSQSRSNPNGPRLFFDIGHRDWRRRDNGSKRFIVAHEYTHGIQSTSGAKLWSRSYMDDWMEEGMAEFYAAEIMGPGGTNSRMARNALEWANDNGAIRFSLEQLSGNGDHPHPGGMGHLAVIGLVELAPKGVSAPLTYTFSVRQKGQDRAFLDAFGMSRAEFHARFERWRRAYLSGSTRNPHWHKI